MLHAGGNLLNVTPRDALTIIENKSNVRTSRNKPVVSKESTTSSNPAYLPEITALTDAVKAMLLQNKTPSPAPVKTIEEIYVTCGGLHPYYERLATEGNTFNAFAAIRAYNQGTSKRLESEKPCLYEIPYDNSDHANRICHERKRTMTLENGVDPN
ncbi:hypothetical protein Tco_0465937 [Tanacetum coccineum]